MDDEEQARETLQPLAEQIGVRKPVNLASSGFRHRLKVTFNIQNPHPDDRAMRPTARIKVVCVVRLRGQQIRYLTIEPAKGTMIAAIEPVQGDDASAPIVTAVTAETPDNTRRGDPDRGW